MNVIADLLLLYQQALSIDAALGAPLDPGWNVTGLILWGCEFVCTAAIFYPEGTSQHLSHPRSYTPPPLLPCFLCLGADFKFLLTRM